MDLRTVVTALGTGITTFLVVAVLVIELLAFEFSAIVGLPVGLLAGIVAFVAVLLRYDGADERLQWAIAGVAGFGYGIVAALAANYVHLVDVGAEAAVGVGVAVALVALVGSALMDRRGRPA